MSLQEKYETLIKENQALKAEVEKLKKELEDRLNKKQKQPEVSPISDVRPDHSPAEVDKYINPEEKIKLYMSLFRGRKEVYAKRWENKAGRSGYSPVCSNEWKPGICNKSRIKCTNCIHQHFEELNEKMIERHLKKALCA